MALKKSNKNRKRDQEKLDLFNKNEAQAHAVIGYSRYVLLCLIGIAVVSIVIL